MRANLALVTGSSSGIGEATAERLAIAGYKVYGTSRRGAQAGQRSFEMLSLYVTSDESVEAWNPTQSLMSIAGFVRPWRKESRNWPRVEMNQKLWPKPC